MIKVCFPDGTEVSIRHLVRRVLTGMAFSMTGTVLSRATMLLATILTARFLGAVQFGEYSAIQMTLVTGASVASLGLGLASTHYVAMYVRNDPDRAEGIIGFALAMTVITGGLTFLLFFFTSPFVAGSLMKGKKLTGMLALATPVVLFASIQSVQVGVLTGLEAFRAISGLSILAGLATLLFVPSGAHLGGPKGALVGLILATGAACAVNYYGLHRVLRRFGLRIKPGIRKEFLSIIYQYGAPTLVADATVNIGLWAATMVILGSPDGYREVGAFRAANQWYTALCLFPSVVSTVFMPVLSERIESQDRKSAFVLFSRSSILIAAIGSPLALAGMLLAPWVMGLYGHEFRYAGSVLAVMVWTALVQAVQAPVASVVQASGRMWLGALMNVAWTAALFLVFYLLPEQDAYGLAIARLVAYLVHILWSGIFSFSFFKERRFPISIRQVIG